MWHVLSLICQHYHHLDKIEAINVFMGEDEFIRASLLMSGKWAHVHAFAIPCFKATNNGLTNSVPWKFQGLCQLLPFLGAGSFQFSEKPSLAESQKQISHKFHEIPRARPWGKRQSSPFLSSFSVELLLCSCAFFWDALSPEVLLHFWWRVFYFSSVASSESRFSIPFSFQPCQILVIRVTSRSGWWRSNLVLLSWDFSLHYLHLHG